MKNRRKSLRSPSRVPLDLYDLKGRAVVGEGRLVNMSETGAQIESRHLLKQSSRVRVQLPAGAQALLDLAARVVWAKRKPRGFSYGLAFSR